MHQLLLTTTLVQYPRRSPRLVIPEIKFRLSIQISGRTTPSGTTTATLLKVWPVVGGGVLVVVAVVAAAGAGNDLYFAV